MSSAHENSLWDSWAVPDLEEAHMRYCFSIVWQFWTSLQLSKLQLLVSKIILVEFHSVKSNLSHSQPESYARQKNGYGSKTEYIVS